MSYAVGSLVRARGREWVVLPESEDDLLVLRPLGGTDDEVTGIYLPLEKVEPARFDLPDPQKPGDYRSSRLLRDAVRLGFRSSAGPFRSFARIGVEPRPYQLVPLLMALKLDPIRLLIADDVGIGKTVEAGLVARELIDRGEVHRLAVLCPPQLAEQWQAELRDKFHIDAELVLPSTVTRLERNTRLGESLFDLYPYVIVSTDFIKSDRRREEFLRTCPELVIVDEAHTCAYGGEGRGGGRHQRHQLVSGLSRNKDRHMILVTATPHSGNEEAFRSLLTLLDPDFAGLPEDLSGPQNEHYRRQLAAHFVQRRRRDIKAYLDTITPFPAREETELSYKLSEEYKRLFEKVLRYARETVADTTLGKHRQRVRWWSALALLRSLASSPAAAAATLRSRASTADTDTAEEADEIGRRTVLDLMDAESAEGMDLTPGSDTGEEESTGGQNRRRLLEMAREADALIGEKDAKLQKAVGIVQSLLKEGYRPIIFCRFIPTAEYVASELRARLPKDVQVAAVTGTLPPTEREARVGQLAETPKHVLVCTDCLSEGINLQQHFDAVVHYDLAWNPTRHEQREGRVDRYGQKSPTVRVVTYYGLDNQIDGIVLEILIRKHKMIRSSLGISVPVPVDTDQVLEAVFEGLLLREKTGSTQMYMPGFEDLLRPQEKEILAQWDAAEEREKRSHTMYAQEGIKVDEVAAELRDVRAAIGSGVDVANFTKETLVAQGAVISQNGSVHFDLTEVPVALRDAMDVTRWTERGKGTKFAARFELPVGEQELYLSRTHPIVEGLASYVMDTALDPLGESLARRCGVIRTHKVSTITTLLLLRFRYHIISQRGAEETPLLAEDCQLVAFEGVPQSAHWLDSKRAEELLHLQPDANVPASSASHFLGEVMLGFDELRPHLDEVAVERGEELLEAHRRVRTASRMKGISYRVEPQLPPDVLGIYVYLPKA
jgi:superfamily II DNA or RNA helicase